jgi:predicted nucleic acid-binding protein
VIVIDANLLVYAHVSSYRQHGAQITAWLDAGPVWTPAPTARHRDALDACLTQPGLRANDVPDAHLAALAIEHGLRLATSDSGFARFSGLQWFNPLQAV